MNKTREKVKSYEHNLYNHHPFISSYLLCIFVLWGVPYAGFKGKMAYYLYAILLSVVFIFGNVTARLSLKKSELAKWIYDHTPYPQPKIPYIDNVGDAQDFGSAIIANDIFIGIIALIAFGDSAIFMGILFVIVIAFSFIDFEYYDDEYQQILKHKEQVDINEKERQRQVQEAYKEEQQRLAEERKPMYDALAAIYPNLEVKNSHLEVHNLDETPKRSNKTRNNKNFKSYSFRVAGTTHHDLKKAINFARKEDLLFDRYEGYTAKEIKEDGLDPVYETDLSEAINSVILTPEPDNKYDSDAIKVSIGVGSKDFFIGYVPSDWTQHVHSTLKHFKNGTQKVKVMGHVVGGKYKYVDEDDHVRVASSNPGFVVVVKYKDTGKN